MAGKITIHGTDHLRKRAQERGVTADQVKETITFPTHIEKHPIRKGEHNGFIRLFSRPFDERILVVVAETLTNEYWVITAYWQES